MKDKEGKGILKKLFIALSSLWVLSVIAIVLVGALRVSSDSGGVSTAEKYTASVNAGYANIGNRYEDKLNEEEAARVASHDAAIAEAEKYAYLDIESASDELREKILSSRNVIIFSKTWVADGVGIGGTGSIYSDEVEVAPYFSELFPGWDIP
jgi:hypothetical protein